MKVLVLAGGFDQIALVEELKKRGHDVILADYLERPPAQSFVRKHYRVSTLDEQAVYNIALQEKIDLITTACTDQALLTVASVSEKLGLPCYLDIKTATNVTNKVHMKTIFLENNIPTSRFYVVNDIQRIEAEEVRLSYPVVVKPCDCNSSKGVVKVYSKADLLHALQQAMVLSRSNNVIIEEYISGQELSIDVWIDNEGAKILGISISNKIPVNEEEFTIFQSCYPVKLSLDIEKQIIDIANNISNAFSIFNSPMLIQAIVHDNKVYVIEFSARMGGGSKYKFIEYMSGIDIMHKYVNMVLGDTSQVLHPVMSCEAIEVDYVYARPGNIGKFLNFELLKEKEIIDEVFYYKNIGDFIEKMTTSSDRVLGFLIHSKDIKYLEQIRLKIIDSVDIVDDNGDSMMYKKCFLGDINAE